MIYLEQMPDLEVTFGTLTLHLSEYRIVGGCLVHEQGTSAGAAAVSAVYPKGTRITLKGRIAVPEPNFAEAGAALDAAVRSGIGRTVTLGTLVCADMRLIGYTLAPMGTAAEVALVFYTQTPLETEEEP